MVGDAWRRSSAVMTLRCGTLCLGTDLGLVLTLTICSHVAV